MYKFHHSLLPSVFDSFLVDVSKVHEYNTRDDLLLINHTTFPELELIMAFSISDSRVSDPSVWNALNDSIKSLSLAEFKKILKQNVFSSY